MFRDGKVVMRKRNTLLFWLVWMAASATNARTVVYTDSQHPPINLSSETQIVWLDAVEQHQKPLFAQLSFDPQQALIQAQAILQSSHWHQQEQQLIKAYRVSRCGAGMAIRCAEVSGRGL